MENLISEELKRIKKLFGDELLYGNLNNLNEQVGRYFKKVWDDFKVKNPNAAKNFNEIKVKKFTDTDIKSLDDVFKHLSENADIWKAIGLTDQDITISSLIQKQITSKNNPSFLFQESSVPGKYFFDFIPVEGGLRGEVFYWYSKKYPNAWVEGLRSLPSEQKSKTTGLKDLGGTEISTNVDLPTLPKVRVDKNGYPIDFKDGKPVDKLGNEVKLLDDGKPDTALATIESTDTSTLTPIRVDENGLPIDFDANNRPLDIDGDFINIGDDGRPTDPDRPRIDDDYNPVDNQGNPLDEAGKYRRDQVLKFNTAEKLFETYIVPVWPGKVKFWQRIIDYMNGVDVQTKVLTEFNQNLNTLVRQTLDNQASGLDIVTLRSRVVDKFLELQKISQDKLSAEFLMQIKERVKDIEVEGLVGDARIARSRELDTMWKNLEQQDDGLAKLFALMEKDKSIADNVGSRIKAEWKDFWYVDILQEKLNKSTSAQWKTYTSHIITSLAKRYWSIFWKQSPYSKVELQRILLRYGANRNAIIYRQLVHLIATKVLQPIIWGTGVYLFYGDKKIFGGFRRILEDVTGGEFTDADRTSLYDDYIKPTLLKPFGLSEEDFSIGEMMISLTPTWFDETAKGTITILKKSEESKEETKKTLKIEGAENLKYKPQLIAAETDRRTQCIGTIGELLSLDGWTYIKLNNSGLEPQAKKLSSLLIIPESEDDKINTKAKLDSGVREVRPMFYIDGVGDLYISKSLDKNVYYVEDKAGNNRTPMLDFLETYGEKILLQTNIENKFKTKADLDKEKEKLNKEKLDKIKQVELDIKNNMLNNSYYRTKKIIMEDTGKKFGEDNFKHWKDTFTFKSGDDKNPGQYKEVKINMEDVMDRIDHFRKKYDEDDAFVRAVIDTHEDVVKIMYTKGLADIRESVTPRGLALVLRTLNESRGEMEIFSVARPANGNWFLVKGDYTQSQLANMDLEKKEPEDKEKKKDISGSEELKKKEEKAIRALKSNEKEGLDDLPKKVREKLLEKMGRGWTTETPPSFLEKLVEKSQINTIFNDKIDIFKLDSNDDTFDAIVDNSSQIFIKKGFCRSLYIANDNANLDEKQEKVINHILEKCDRKFGGKLGVRNF